MANQWMHATLAVGAKAAAVSVIASGMARAGEFSANLSVPGAAGYDLPADYAMLFWAPVLLLTFACVGGLLWLIRSDIRQYQLAGRQIAEPRRIAFMPTRRVAHLHR